MGSSRMPFRHLANARFTIRGLMIAVAAIAGLLGLLHTWLELLLFAATVGLLSIPAMGLIVACGRPPAGECHRAGIVAGL